MVPARDRAAEDLAHQRGRQQQILPLALGVVRQVEDWHHGAGQSRKHLQVRLSGVVALGEEGIGGGPVERDARPHVVFAPLGAVLDPSLARRGAD